MRQRTITLLALATLALAGCQSTKEKAAYLQADYDKIDAQYKAKCDDPFASTDPQQAPKVLRDSMTAADKAAFRQRERDRQVRIASPHCKEIEAKRTQLGKDLLAAQSKVAGQS